MSDYDKNRHRDDLPEDEDHEEAALENMNDVPVTGDMSGVMDAPLDQVSMSDLVDLSDVEAMEDYADALDPLDILDLIDTDADEMAKYTEDEDILDDLTTQQSFATGTEQLLSTMKEYTEQSPDLTGKDVDARWWADHQSGEESVGGSVATPEQNVVDDLGEALGVEYNDFEPLNIEDRLANRDENRWELNAASADDDETEADFADDKSKQSRRDEGDDSKELDEDFSTLMNEDFDDEVDQDKI